MGELNKHELRRLAQSLPHKDWYAGNAYGKKFIADYQVIAPTPEGNYVLLEGNQNFLDHAVANVAFVGACSPAAIISLLDELAQAKCEAAHAIQQKDAAYSECKELRQDAERYRWVSSGVQEAETLLSVVICHGGDTAKAAERIDIYMEASKDLSHD